jgi:hypothetical protein
MFEWTLSTDLQATETYKELHVVRKTGCITNDVIKEDNLERRDIPQCLDLGRALLLLAISVF